MTKEQYQKKVDSGNIATPEPLLKGAFFDVDGVLRHNDKSKEGGHWYVTSPDQVEWIDGAKEAMALAKAKGYEICWVTNQNGIGEGLVSEDRVFGILAEMAMECGGQGPVIDNIAYCPHHPAIDCECRKPKPGMIFGLACRLGISLSKSFLIGDSGSDIMAGIRAGIPIPCCRRVNNRIPGGDTTTLRWVQILLGEE